AGRIAPLDARMWYHLYNPDDHVFTAELRVHAENFVEIQTRFDKPNDLLNHDALWYFNHAATQNRVWLDLSGARSPRTLARDVRTAQVLSARPVRRALLVGINAYPSPANRLPRFLTDTLPLTA